MKEIVRCILWCYLEEWDDEVNSFAIDIFLNSLDSVELHSSLATVDNKDKSGQYDSSEDESHTSLL